MSYCCARNIFIHSLYIVPYQCLLVSFQPVNKQCYIVTFPLESATFNENTLCWPYVIQFRDASAPTVARIWLGIQMARRPSVASMATVPLSPTTIERTNSLQPLSILGSPSFLSFNNMRLPSRTVSLTVPANLGSPEEVAKMDSESDELFTRNSVAQIKEIQRRLRYGHPTNQRFGHFHTRLLGMTRMRSKKN